MKDLDDLNLFLENSLGKDSNLLSLLETFKCSTEINEANNVTGDLNAYKALISKVISRFNNEAGFEKFCNVIPSSTPSGKLPILSTVYVGSTDDEANATDNLKILKVVDESAFVEDGDITSAGGGEGTVLHVEAGQILVKVDIGTFVAGEAIDNANPYVAPETTISSVFTATHSVGTLLKDYSGEYVTAVGEPLFDYKEIEFTITNAEVTATSKFINSGLTLEYITDMFKQYGVKWNTTLVNSLVRVITVLQRQKIYAYMRANAYQRPDITLTNSYGVNGGIANVYGDLYSRVNESIGAIGTNSGVSGQYAIVCSSKVYAGIKTHLGKEIIGEDRISKLPDGSFLIEDGYSSNDYMTVALVGENGENNGAVIYSPYLMQVITAKDNKDFKEKIKVMLRSDVIDNPLATKVNDQAKNEMMEYTVVDFTALTHSI